MNDNALKGNGNPVIEDIVSDPATTINHITDYCCHIKALDNH